MSALAVLRPSERIVLRLIDRLDGPDNYLLNHYRVPAAVRARLYCAELIAPAGFRPRGGGQAWIVTPAGHAALAASTAVGS